MPAATRQPFDEPARDLDERRRAEIEAAWAEYRQTPVQISAQLHRDWLIEHFEAQHGKCAYCNVPMTLGTFPRARDRRATLDHIVARSVGGADDKDNTLAACHHCNTTKSSMSRQEYLLSQTLRVRREAIARVPNRLSNDPDNPHYDELALDRGIRVFVNGNERRGVTEYCISEGWIRLETPSLDRRGRRLVLTVRGAIEATYKDASEG